VAWIAPLMRKELTAREIQVLRFLLAGATNSDIAVHLGRHINTVAITRRSIQSKLGALGSVQLGFIAATMGLEPDRTIAVNRGPAQGQEQYAGKYKKVTPRGAGRMIGRDL
jgi:DNA-binding CsgD family transcriptional regulator